VISPEAEGITSAAFREHDIRDALNARASALIPRERVILAEAKAAVLLMTKLFQRFDFSRERYSKRFGFCEMVRRDESSYFLKSIKGNIST